MQNDLVVSGGAGGISGRALLRNFVPVAIVLLIVAELLFQPKFGTYQNLVNVARMAALLALVSVGQMMVIMVRGFDLAIGGTMAFTSIVVATALARAGTEDGLVWTGLVGIAVALGTGLGIGILNGIAVGFLRVHSFIVTLGMSSILVGLAQMLTNGVPIYGIPRAFITAVGRSAWLGVPSFVWIAATAILLLALLLNSTRTGKYLRAAGRDERAAELSGIRTRVYIVLAYAVCAACAALAALLLTTQLGSGQASIGTVYAFQSIAVCIIGGVSLMGGRGSVTQVVLAAVFMQLLNNALELLRVPSPAQAAVTGAIVVVVAVVHLWRKAA